jgi:hypothetical protein
MKSRFLLTALLIFHFSLFTFHCPAQDAEQIYKKVNDAVVTVYAYDSYQKIKIGTQIKMIAYDKIRFFNLIEEIISCHKQSFLSAFPFCSDKMVVRHNGKIVEYTAIHPDTSGQRHPHLKDSRPYLSIHRHRQLRPLECRAKDKCNRRSHGF